MSDLDKQTVLVLNKAWQAINAVSVKMAICQMVADVSTALCIEGDKDLRPVKWSEWITLPIREGDEAVLTVRGPIRVPTVIVLANYSKVPHKRPKLNRRTIWERDRGVCQYSGRKLRLDEGSIDHVIPRSRGGATSWENCVLADQRVNFGKADKLPTEAGLRLIQKPSAPKPVPVVAMIKNNHGIRDWDLFCLR